jgi:hypothetical protein
MEPGLKILIATGVLCLLAQDSPRESFWLNPHGSNPDNWYCIRRYKSEILPFTPSSLINVYLFLEKGEKKSYN